LVAGEQDQRGPAVAVVERPLERREVFCEPLAKPVDRAGAVGAEIVAAGGQDIGPELTLTVKR
jgi:hypothetical protein